MQDPERLGGLGRGSIRTEVPASQRRGKGSITLFYKCLSIFRPHRGGIYSNVFWGRQQVATFGFLTPMVDGPEVSVQHWTVLQAELLRDAVARGDPALFVLAAQIP